MENIVGKGEIAHFEQFQLFPQCFPKAFFVQCVKTSIYGEKGQRDFLTLLDNLPPFSSNSKLFRLEA